MHAYRGTGGQRLYESAIAIGGVQAIDFMTE